MSNLRAFFTRPFPLVSVGEAFRRLDLNSNDSTLLGPNYALGEDYSEVQAWLSPDRSNRLQRWLCNLFSAVSFGLEPYGSGGSWPSEKRDETVDSDPNHSYILRARLAFRYREASACDEIWPDGLARTRTRC